jgi:hypothetical protein
LEFLAEMNKTSVESRGDGAITLADGNSNYFRTLNPKEIQELSDICAVTTE